MFGFTLQTLVQPKHTFQGGKCRKNYDLPFKMNVCLSCWNGKPNRHLIIKSS